MELEYLKKCNVCQSENIKTIDATHNFCQCQECGYIFNNPRPTAKAIADFYSKEGKYDFWFEEARDLQNMRSVSMIRKYKAAGDLLDVGAGPGQFLNQAKKYFNVSGTEVSKRAIKLAKEKYNIDLFEGEMQNINFGDKKFDVITIKHVLEHVPDPSDLLKRCRTLLKKDGIIVIMVPNDINSAGAAIRRLLSVLKIGKWKNRGKFGLPKIDLNGFEDEIHLSHFRQPVLRKLLVNNGFEVIGEKIDPAYLLKKYKRIPYDLFYWFSTLVFHVTKRNIFRAIWMAGKVK